MVGQHSQVTMNGHISSHSSPMPSHYSDSPPSYAEQSHTPSYNYVSTSAVHPSSAARTDIQDPSYEYSHTYEKSPVARIHSSSLHHSQSMDSMHNSQPSHMSSVSSRLSISHISHPQSYPNHYTGAPSPESNHSISSHSQPSGPPTPNYTAYRDDSHESASYQNHQSILEPVVDQSNISSGYMNSQNHLVHGTYSHTLIAQQGLPRYDSPPPILAPIQDERVIRGDPRIPHMHHSTSLPGSMSYMHHSQPHNAYSYQTPRLSLGQGYGSLRGQNTAGFA
ncbi:hypothetical protein BJ138DRAFT_1153171 [Hygrophoropsis aurantiaca]|uniref:Uncharacterized protein n=1 Tax=Hygrophoropsis aurantiaca TaxID=72124 RepID=A0ACB8ACA5_9AGAM|nr:hypothetical protein BJ138DRAFT_1153171 [Hygrophoropsis aurantiaca]